MRTSVLICLLILVAPADHLMAAGGQLDITVIDRDTGKQIPCRMHLRSATGKPRKPDAAPFWHDHFVFPGKITLKLPVGNYTFEMERGPEYLNREGHFTIEGFADDAKQIDLGRFIDMKARGWWSGDLDVRRSPHDIELLMRAEDLHVAEVMTWRNEKSDWTRQTLPKEPLVRFDGDCWYHLTAGAYSPSGSELLLLNLPGPPKTAHAGKGFLDRKVLLEARQHPGAWVDLSRPFSWDLPMLAATGQIDSIELAPRFVCRDAIAAGEPEGKPRDRLFAGPRGNAKWAHHVYFQLLECGLRIPPTAGSGSGDTPNPVGYNRVYVHVDGEITYEKWWQNLRAGRVVVTNGPLMQPTVHGKLPGHVFQAEQGEKLEFEIALTLSTRDPITYLELIQDGKVVHEIRFDQYAKSGKLPKLQFDRSGWFLVRAVTDVPKTYRFAMTGPYYVEIGYQPRISRRAAQFFLDWVYERARQIKQADPQQRGEALEDYRAVRDFWQKLVDKATVE